MTYGRVEAGKTTTVRGCRQAAMLVVEAISEDFTNKLSKASSRMVACWLVLVASACIV
jgi:hypothetical protein